MQTPRPKSIVQCERIMCINDVPPEHVTRMFAWLKHLYQAPSRIYHNWEYIEEMLLAAAHRVPAKINLAQYYAILFHDAVYEPGIKGSEAASVKCLRLFLKSEREHGLWVSPQIILRASRIIMDTINHQPTGTDSSVMLDLSLMRLAVDYDAFLSYANMVEEEYSVIVGHEDFMVGRLKFFQQLISKSRLFYTSLGEKKWELRARGNIQKYLLEHRGYIEHAKVLH